MLYYFFFSLIIVILLRIIVILLLYFVVVIFYNVLCSLFPRSWVIVWYILFEFYLKITFCFLFYNFTLFFSICSLYIFSLFSVYCISKGNLGNCIHFVYMWEFYEYSTWHCVATLFSSLDSSFKVFQGP